MTANQEDRSRLDMAQKLERDGDFANAFKIYLELGETENPDVHAALGRMFASGTGTEINFEKAEHYFRLPGQMGDFRAQWNLGRLALKRGDLEQAIHWFEKSSAAGYAPASYRLAMHYVFGRGVAKDERKALNLLEESAAAGNIRAQFAFAKRLIRGQRGMGSIPTGIILLIRACKEGFLVRYKNPYDERMIW